MVLIRFQPFRFDTCLAFRAFFPTGTRSFVATDMNILRWEDLNDFTHYIFQELHRLVVTDTEHIFKYTPTRAYFVRTTCTSHFGVSSQCGKHVSGQVYFRNYRNVTFLCIFHDLFRFFLSKETAIRRIVILLCVSSDYRTTALRTYFRKFRILLNLDAPALVVRQVPVESIHVM